MVNDIAAQSPRYTRAIAGLPLLLLATGLAFHSDSISRAHVVMYSRINRVMGRLINLDSIDFLESPPLIFNAAGLSEIRFHGITGSPIDLVTDLLFMCYCDSH